MNTLELEEALQSISSMIHKSEKAQLKFKEATSQYILLKNRIKALRIAYALVEEQRNGTHKFPCEEEAVKKALAPITSLLSKSNKAITKLKETSWQYRMLKQNIEALDIALAFLEDKIKRI